MKRRIPARALIGYLFIFLVSLSACNPLTSRSVEGNISIDYKSATPESDVIQYAHDTESSAYVLFLINNSVSMTAQERYQIPIFYISLLNSKASEHKNAWVGISSFPNIYSTSANGRDTEVSYGNLMEFENITSSTDLSGLISLPKTNLDTNMMGSSIKSATEEFEKSNFSITDNDKKALVIVTDNDSQDNNDSSVELAITAALMKKINVYVVVFPSSTTPIASNWWKRLETTVSDNYGAEFKVFDIQTDISQITQLLYGQQFFVDILPRPQGNIPYLATQNSTPITKLQQIGSKSFETPGDTFKLEIYGVTPTPNATFELRLDGTLGQAYSLISDRFGRFRLNILVKPTMNCSKRIWTLIGSPAYFWWNARTPEFTINNLAEIDGSRVNNEPFEISFDVSSPYESETDINSLVQDFGRCYTLNFSVIDSYIKIPSNQILLEKLIDNNKIAQADPICEITLDEAYFDIQQTGSVKLMTRDKNLLSSGKITIIINTAENSPEKSVKIPPEIEFTQSYQPIAKKSDLQINDKTYLIELDYFDLNPPPSPEVYFLRASKEAENEECKLVADRELLAPSTFKWLRGTKVCGGGVACTDYATGYTELYWDWHNTNKGICINIPVNIFEQCEYKAILIQWQDMSNPEKNILEWDRILCTRDEASQEGWFCEMKPASEFNMKPYSGQ